MFICNDKAYFRQLKQDFVETATSLMRFPLVLVNILTNLGTNPSFMRIKRELLRTDKKEQQNGE